MGRDKKPKTKPARQFMQINLVGSSMNYIAPFKLFIITMVSIFVVEALIMFILPFLSPLPLLTEALLDALMLCLFVFPSLYFFSLRPMLSQINKLKSAEAEKEEVISQLREALDNIKTLKGLLPICANCKSIRNDKGYWNQLESYILEHTDAEFTHCCCPDCLKKLYPDVYERIQNKL